MNKLYFFIKWILEHIFNLNMFFIKKSKERRIILLLTPQYLNFGDHAIGLAEKRFFKKYIKDREVIEVNLSFYQFFPQFTRKIITEKDTIVITGGGYMGSIWPDLQQTVNDILRNYPNNKIILAPQTIFFSDTASNAFLEFKSLIQNHKNIFIYAREENTFHMLTEKLVPSHQCALGPDMVLFLKPHIKRSLKKRSNIGLCMRTDCEKCLPDEQIQYIKNILSTQGEAVCEMKMAYEHVEIPVFLRSCFVQAKLKHFAGKKLIVTDRLHGMLFAAITATPCIAFDNISKKVSGVYQWISSLSYIKIVQNMEQFKQALNDFDSCSNEPDYFSQLAKLQNQLFKHYVTKFTEHME